MARYSKQITYNTIGTVVTMFCQWLIMMIIPRITDFSEAGVFAIAISICSVMNIFATFSMNQYQISDQYVNYTENEYRVCRLFTITVSFILTLLFILFFSYSLEQNLVIIFYMVYRNLLHYAYLYTATLQIHERLDYVGKATIAEGIVSLISFTAVYLFTNDLVLSVAAMALLGGGLFLVAVARGYRKIVGRPLPKGNADRQAVKSMIIMGVPLLLSVAAPAIITALPRIMLQAVGGDEIVGIFSTLSAPTIIIPTLITGIFTPFIVYFSKLSRSGDIRLLRKQYSKMTLLVLAFGLLLFAVSYFFAGYFFELLYGQEIVPYVKYFNVMIIGITLYSIGMWGITVLITKEQGRPAAIASLLSLVAGFIIFAVAIPEYGIDGATYGLMVAYGIFGLLISLCVLFLPLKNLSGGREGPAIR